MATAKTKIGIIGCGNISGIYFKMCKFFENLEVVACSDIDMEKARAKGAEWGVPARAVDEMLSDPTIEIIVNLTVPKAHAQVNLAALNAGKSAYCEKPFAVNRQEGAEVMKIAESRGLLVGGAPDTFMGGGIQTCRKLLDEGWIGQPVACTAFMLCHGHESWHPSPEFYYEIGGGPMFDMGPYYLTALVNLLGPVRRVTAATRITFPERLITNQPKFGKRVKVETPTHIAGVMDFHCGAIGTIVTSFDVWSAQVPCIEIYGTEGTMQVPDPNGFGGAVRIHRPGMNTWAEIPLVYGYTENSRGIGVADMAKALRSGRKPRASGELAFHVLDIMCAFHEASEMGRHIQLQSACQRPAALPMGLPPGRLDD